MKLRYAVLPLCLLTALPSLAAARGFDVRDMVALDRVSSPTLSPDGSVLVFAKRQAKSSNGKPATGLWTRNLRTRDAAPPRWLTPDGWNVNSPALSPDGKTVYFLSSKSGTQQLYAQPLAGGAPQQLTAFAVDVDSYKLARRQAHCFQCRRVPGLRLGPGLHQDQARQAQERQGQWRGL